MQLMTRANALRLTPYVFYNDLNTMSATGVYEITPWHLTRCKTLSDHKKQTRFWHAKQSLMPHSPPLDMVFRNAWLVSGHSHCPNVVVWRVFRQNPVSQRTTRNSISIYRSGIERALNEKQQRFKARYQTTTGDTKLCYVDEVQSKIRRSNFDVLKVWIEYIRKKYWQCEGWCCSERHPYG